MDYTAIILTIGIIFAASFFGSLYNEIAHLKN